MGVFAYQSYCIKIEKEKISYVLDITIEHVKTDLSRYVDLTSIWSKAVNTNSDITYETFNYLAKSIYDNDVNIESIILAPDNIQKFIYPTSQYNIDLQGNASPLTDTFITLDNEKRFVNVMAPIYAGGYDKSYWGYVDVTVKNPNLFNDSYLLYLDNNGFSYNLSYYYGEMKSHITASDVPVTKTALTKGFSVCNSKWSMSIQPAKGWINKTILLIQIAGSMFVSFCVSQLAWLISILREKNKSMERMSYEDELTGLSNSRKFTQIKSILRKNNDPYAIFFIDLNYFKVLNDTQGHELGDKMLQIVARRLVNSVKVSDLVFRVGGDEFVVLINGGNTRSIYEDIKKRLFNNVCSSINIGETTITPDISIGYASYPDDGYDIDDIVKLAERYMYAEKADKKIER